MALAVGIVAFAVSFGPAFPLYAWLYSAFPLMTGIRGAVRFGQFVLAAVAILAGFGLATLERRVRRGALALSIALIAVAHVEALRAPMDYPYKYRGIPAIWDTLKNAGPDGVVVCFPYYGALRVHDNSRYMLVSTRFWTPMLNGYSGFAPRSYFDHYNALVNFPDRASIDFLRQLHVTHVVIEGQKMDAAPLARLDGFPELQMQTTDGNLRIYVLR
jgi:hypothetical protein